MARNDNISGAAAAKGGKPYPAIKPGTGRVVPMTSRMLSKDLVSLKLAGAAAAIAATDTHPVYSEDRAAFVPVGSLAVGERVRTADGWAMVESLACERGDGRPTLVCNLEVEGEHTFLVGELGLVSHNDSVVGGTCGIAGEFSIWDWKGYPSSLARPRGPFRLLTGSERAAARAAADASNRAIREELPLWSSAGLEWHELHPIKFGGSPTDLANKIPIPARFHRTVVTPWWRSIQRRLEGR